MYTSTVLELVSSASEESSDLSHENSKKTQRKETSVKNQPNEALKTDCISFFFYTDITKFVCSELYYR